MVRDIDVISRTCKLSGRVAGEMQCHCDAGPDIELFIGMETGIEEDRPAVRKSTVSE
jgi:hypothetical protein